MNFDETKEKRVAKVFLYDYALTQTNLDNLASEFYGKILTQLNITDGIIEVGFGLESDKLQFERALKCFKIDFGNEKEGKDKR